MALSRTNRLGSNSGTGIGTASHTTTSFTPSSNSVLVVCVVDITDDTSGDTSSELTVSGGGWTYTPELNEGKTLSPAQFALNARIWTAQVSTGASMTLTFDHGTRSVHRYVYSVFDYTGAHTSDPGGVTGVLEAGPLTGVGTFDLSGSPTTGSEVVGMIASDTADATTPGTGWTEVHDVQALGDAGIQTQVKAAAPVAPTFAAAGTGLLTATSGAALTPALPSGVTAGQLLIAHVFYGGNSAAPSTPSDWAILDGPDDLGTPATNGRSWVFGKIAAGGDAAPAFGTQAVTTPRRARCYRFPNVRSDTLANVVGGFDFATQNLATYPDTGVTTPEGNCLAVNLVAQPDDLPASVAFTGETGGDWTEAVAEFTGTTGTPDTLMQIQTAAMPTAGTVNGGTQASGTALNRGIHGFYIRGNAANSPTVSWVNVDTGTAAATMLLGLEIKEASGTTVNGVATATLTFTATAAGTPETFGAATATLSFTATAAGVDRALGAATAALSFTGTASGIAGAPPVEGQATAALSFTGSAAGVPETFGQAAATLGFTGTASGVPRTPGAATASLTFTGTAAGIDRAIGQATASLGFVAVAAGTPETFGAATASLTFTGTANGFAGTPPVTGQATAALAFTGVASGIDRALGVAAAGLTFTGTAAGIDRALGAAVGPFALTATAIGARKTFAQAAAVLAFSGTATAFVGEIPTPSGHPLEARSDSYGVSTGPDIGLLAVDVHALAAGPESHAVEVS